MGTKTDGAVQVDLSDRAPGGETRAFLAVHQVMLGIWGSCYSDEYLAEVSVRVCEALDRLGRQQPGNGSLTAQTR